MDRIKVRYSEKAAQFPLKRGTEFSAGFDLRVFPSEDRFTIAPGRRATFGTGVSFEIPPGLVGIVASRSGLGFRGLVVANGIGVIDSDYRGEVSVCLLNTSDQPFTVRYSDRVAQIIFTPAWMGELEEVSRLGETERGLNGFGSTGIA